MKWTSINDRLPISNTNLLINIKIKNKNVNYVSIGYHEPYDDIWFDEFNNKISYKSVVTHWQHLPKPIK